MFYLSVGWSREDRRVGWQVQWSYKYVKLDWFCVMLSCFIFNNIMFHVIVFLCFTSLSNFDCFPRCHIPQSYLVNTIYLVSSTMHSTSYFCLQLFQLLKHSHPLTPLVWTSLFVLGVSHYLSNLFLSFNLIIFKSTWLTDARIASISVS